jgi:hypothetical protein
MQMWLTLADPREIETGAPAALHEGRRLLVGARVARS